MAERKRMGVQVIVFLLIFSGLAYMMHRREGKRAKAVQKRDGGPWHE